MHRFSWLDAGHASSATGFRAGTADCGIKYRDRDDLALVVSSHPCAGAAVFTQNLVKAAPVIFDMQLMATTPQLYGVLMNAGNANACTGDPGMLATVVTAQATARALDLPAGSVFVMSTGTIGVPFPTEKLLAGLPQAIARLAPDGGLRAARAIMTTDTVPKHCALRVRLPSGPTVTIGGMCKGAGMISPSMATLLALVTTDAAVAPATLQAALQLCVARSFNCITVDGDQSTNDTLLVLANGLAGNTPLTALDSPDGVAFLEALTAVCVRLAQAVARDGEGATRFVTIHVSGAPSEAAARQAAMTVAKSPLVKTALYGADPNWGRVLCALGNSGVDFDPGRVTLDFGGLRVLAGGLPLAFDEQEASRRLDQPEVQIDADLGAGSGEATVWTCDMSPGYIEVNASYRT